MSLTSGKNNTLWRTMGRLLKGGLALMMIMSLHAQAQDEQRLKVPARGILLFNQPQLWNQAERTSDATEQSWTAGTGLQVLEVKAGKDSQSGAPMTWFRVQCGGTQGWLPEVYVSTGLPEKDEQPQLVRGRRVDRWHALGPGEEPEELKTVGPGLEKDRTYQLTPAAAGALASMVNAARTQGIKLYIVSAYRPWQTQQRLYERKLRKSGWDQNTVAKPGHSEHQLGTTVDLSDGDEETLLRESFGQSPAGRWLRENAWVYGFAQSFTPHNQPVTGIAPEPWHYRYWGLGQARAKHLEALGETAGAEEKSNP